MASPGSQPHHSARMARPTTNECIESDEISSPRVPREGLLLLGLCSQLKPALQSLANTGPFARKNTENHAVSKAAFLNDHVIPQQAFTYCSEPRDRSLRPFVHSIRDECDTIHSVHFEGVCK